jgi:hypothetical protein
MPHGEGHSWWGDSPIVSGAFGAADMAARAEDLAGDIDWAQMRTPVQDWQAFTMGITPNMNRIPLQNMRNQLMTRYALANPFGVSGVNAAGDPTLQGDLPQSFAGWLGGTGVADQADLATLRNRAAYAAEIAGLSEEDYTGRLATAGGVGTAAGRRLATAAGTWNPIQGGSASNQQAVAQLLAMQRAGGGTYQGAMGNAIQRAMNAMYTAREQRGQDPNTFLAWYMGLADQEGVDTAVPTSGVSGVPFGWTPTVA